MYDGSEPFVDTVKKQDASHAARLTYWQHDPYATPGSDQVEAAAIAKEFIGLFDRALRKRQCRVMTGVEIECVLAEPEERFGGSLKMQNHTAIAHIATQLGLYEYHNLKREGRRDSEKPDDKGKIAPGTTKYKPGLVYRAYDDHGDMEIVTYPASALKTLAAVRGIKKLLTEATKEFSQTTDARPSVSAKRFRAAINPGKVRFGSFEGVRSCGEHINLSLHATDDGSPDRMFDLAANNVTQHFSGVIHDALFRHVRNDLPLLLGSRASYMRLFGQHPVDMPEHPGFHMQPVYADGDKNKDFGNQLSDKAAQRIEFRAPDASSDIHRTMLLTMARIFASVDALCQVTGESSLRNIPASADLSARAFLNTTYPAPEIFPSHMPTALQLFNTQSLTLTMMRRMVEEEIPVELQAGYQAKIDRFKQIVTDDMRRTMSPAAGATR